MHKLFIRIILVFLMSPVLLWAQPSGGSYGPVQQNYEIPMVSGIIYYVSPEGDKNAKGTKVGEPTSLEAAIEKVKSGDAIILRGGTYRIGNLKFNQGITLQPYQDEKPVIKGTLVASNWEKQDNGLWLTTWDNLFPSKPQDWWRRHRNGNITPMHRFNDDMVFVDGKFLQSAGWEGEMNEDTYYIDYENNHVYLCTDPTGKIVEITAFSSGLIRTTADVHGKTSDGIGPKIKGIKFTQYPFRIIEVEGYYPQGISAESDHGHDVTATMFENCTMSYCGRIGVNLIGDSLVFRHCKVSDTSTEGLYLVSSDDALIEKNIFTRNNIEQLTGYYPAAVKIFNQCYRTVFKDNLLLDLPFSNGVWYDVGNVDGQFINNWVEGVGFPNNDFNPNRVYPSKNGFFFEISKGAICAGNVFNQCDHGILILNSNNVKVYQNTFVNSLACFGRNSRSVQSDHFGWHPSTGPDVDERTGHEFVNNLLVKNESYNGPLLFIYQQEFLCEKLKEPLLSILDYNVYINTQSLQTGISICDRQVSQCQVLLDSPSELKSVYLDYEVHHTEFVNYQGPLFKSLELGNFQLLSGFKTNFSAKSLNNKIYKLLLLDPHEEVKPYIGAYPNDIK